MPKTTTKRTKKPKCGPGATACGFTCISGKKRCSDKILKRELEELAHGLPSLTAKKISSAKDALSAINDNSDLPALASLKNVTPETLKVTKDDMGEWSTLFGDNTRHIKKIYERAISEGVEPENALAMAHGLNVWTSSAYAIFSEKTYKPERDIVDKTTSEEAATLAATVAALKTLPKLNTEQLEKAKHSKEWDGENLKRWVKVSPEVLNQLLTKYKEGEVVEELGMFGTSIRKTEKMALFSTDADIEYVVKPKLKGDGKGHYVEPYKDMDDEAEGEVLYEPGTKFKVSKIEEGRNPLSVTFNDYDPDVNLANFRKSEEEMNRYVEENRDSLAAEGFNFEKPYQKPTGRVDIWGNPITQPATKEEVEEAINNSLLVTIAYKKKPKRIFMEEA